VSNAAPAPTGAQRDREDRAEAVDGVECEEHRDLQPRILDCDPLELSDPRWIRDAEDGAEPVADLPFGDQEVRKQLNLLQLLLERHPRDQAVHAGLDRLVCRPPCGLKRLLVPRLRRGHHATCGRRSEGEDQHGGRNREPEPRHVSPLSDEYRYEWALPRRPGAKRGG